MRASGVICEFNPFHSGHAYLLSRMRELAGEEGCVICLMSGRFVQRGEPAAADPYLRAGMALSGGADLVLELPFPWSAASAEHFAGAGVRILARLGVESLAFGSECGDHTLLSHVAGALDTPAFRDTYAALCREGTGTAAAYAKALREAVSIPLPDGFPSSNDLLGITYLQALRRLVQEGITPPRAETVTRRGTAYRDAAFVPDAYPSATALRRRMEELRGSLPLSEVIPREAMPAASRALLLEALAGEEAPLSGERLMAFYHGLYRLPIPPSHREPAEWNGGMAGHIHRAACASATPEAFWEELRTKQYTDARLRRALLFGAVGVTPKDLREVPRYTTLLAANRRGCAYLKEWRKANRDASDGFTVVTKPADAPRLRQRELGEAADALFTLCFPHPKEAGAMLKRTPVIQESSL